MEASHTYLRLWFGVIQVADARREARARRFVGSENAHLPTWFLQPRAETETVLKLCSVGSGGVAVFSGLNVCNQDHARKSRVHHLVSFVAHQK